MKPPRSAKQLAAAIDKVRQNVKEGKPVEDTLSRIADEMRRMKV